MTTHIRKAPLSELSGWLAEFKNIPWPIYPFLVLWLVWIVFYALFDYQILTQPPPPVAELIYLNLDGDIDTVIFVPAQAK